MCPANEDVFAEEAFHKAAALSIILEPGKAYRREDGSVGQNFYAEAQFLNGLEMG